MTKLLLSVFIVMTAVVHASAQCAMCRSTLENNFSNGNPGVAAGFNTGIVYLLMLPYLAAVVVGFLWYKTTKNGGKNVGRRIA